MIVLCVQPKPNSLLDDFSEVVWKLESGHPIGAFLSEATKLVTPAIKMNHHYSFCLSWVQT